MPADKFHGKTKKDLVMIAVLGQVLTASAASRMRKEELIEYLVQADTKIEKASKDEFAEVAVEEVVDELARAEGQAVETEDIKEKATTKAKAKVGPKPRTAKATKAKAKTEVDEDETKAETITKIKVDEDESLAKTKTKTKDEHKVKVSAKSKEGKELAETDLERTLLEVDEIALAEEEPKAVSEHKAGSGRPRKKTVRKADDEGHVEHTKTRSNNGRTGTRTLMPVKADKENLEHEDITEKDQEVALEDLDSGEILEGVLDVMSDGYGFLRKENYLQSSRDIYISPQYIRRYNLRTGDKVMGPGKIQKDSDKYKALLYIKEVNGQAPENMVRRPSFDRLTPIYPDERFVLETSRNELSTRIIDLIAPIGKGQRGMIVSPPKAGKTILLQKIANSIANNNPKTKLIVLLIDERPEEVTDMQRSIKGEVVYSTFDKTPENHVRITELVLERAMRLVELGEDVVILLDSITRLGRAYNLTINPTGRTLSGGLDPGALYGPKRFFGAARNIENGGSLTIIATSLIETGSRMDEVIFEEFKGTGNMEVYLDRKLSEKRIFPAIDINRSGTRREELLLSREELDAVWTIRKAFGQLDTAAVTEMIINLLLKTNHNKQFISSINVSMNDKALFEAMRGAKPTGGQGNTSQSGGGSPGYY